ncbi:MAG: peptidase S10 [Mycobacteriaceae bacterium]
MTQEQTGRTGGDEKTTTDPPKAPEPADDLVTTSHTLTVDGASLAYTATTGRLVLREEVTDDGTTQGVKAKAEVFLTSYTLDDADPATRPVVFCFNGGPGSASVWLHLGLLGPRRVLAGDAGALQGPPYTVVDNPETLLTHADLVFIDPVSTGYSRAVAGGKAGDFHGYTRDLESVGEVIRLWTSRHGRWLAPKFLAGESYGTLRAAGLAEHLQSRHGMYLSGVVLLSSVLDMATIRFTEGNDLPHVLFLPTYAAIAHFHGKHPGRSLAEVLAEAEDLAAGDYARALALGARLTADERASVVVRVARVTGLSEDFVDRAGLRIEHIRFFTELLREQRLTVGRLDGRFTGSEVDAVGERFTADPTMDAIMGPYTAALNHYVRAELDYRNDLPYEMLSGTVNSSWSYREFEGRGVSVVNALGAAMRANPHLRVHVASGYHDGATPYAAADHVLAHLPVPDALRANVEVRYYEAGHMMYVHEPTRRQQSADLAEFVTGG